MNLWHDLMNSVAIVLLLMSILARVAWHYLSIADHYCYMASDYLCHWAVEYLHPGARVVGARPNSGPPRWEGCTAGCPVCALVRWKRKSWHISINQ